MADLSDIQAQVTSEVLERLLAVHGESDALDFKQIIELTTTRGKVELARDVIAFANTDGGGHIVFGVADRSIELTGLPVSVRVDTSDIYRAVDKYIRADIDFLAAEHTLVSPSGNSVRLGILYVAPHYSIVLPACDLCYEDPPGKQQVLARPTTILVRRGAQTISADQNDMDRLLRSRSQLEIADNLTAQSLQGRLPPREEVARQFVGRARELKALWDWFSDPDHRRWVLAGDGGKGKTAIAYEFAVQVRAAAPQGYYIVLWLSAKKRRFVEGEVQHIASPDFYDLDSLLDAIAGAYGFLDYRVLPLPEKRKAVLELLAELPALLVADDIDSLDSQNEAATEFLTYDTSQTASKVLLTTRRIPYGLSTSTTPIAGLDEADGEAFIDSRIQLFRMDTTRFTQRTIREILRITEGSPLFIEDLIRLCYYLQPSDAVRKWQEQTGQAVREYALLREFDFLSESAKELVLACCVAGGPVSLSELQVVTGQTEDQVLDEIKLTQNLFLLSLPRLIMGVERFDVNANTRSLVLSIFRDKDVFRRLTEAYRAISGQRGSQSQRDIGGFIRQAYSLQRLGRHTEAEETIKVGLQRHPNHPDLVASLGVVYYRWRPIRRIADADAQFQRAAQLGCTREWMYCNWAELQLRRSEWSSMALAADAGVRMVGKRQRLCYLAGLAHSRLGQELARGLHSERANDELEAADAQLHNALLDPEYLEDANARDLNSRVFRAIVLNYESMGLLSGASAK